MWILEGVLILAFARLCLCQLISVSRAAALTGSGSIKVIFFHSVHLLVWDEAQRMAVTCGGGGGGGRASLQRHLWVWTASLTREREVPSVRESCPATTVLCCFFVFVFFPNVLNGEQQIFSCFKRWEQFLGQCLKTKMKHFFFSFFGHPHLVMDDERMDEWTDRWMVLILNHPLENATVF